MHEDDSLLAWVRRWQFDRATLEEMSDDLVYRRGRQYFRDGRVLDFDLVDGEIVGSVLGSRRRPYEVRLFAGRYGLQAACDCPFAYGWCKHIVALGLAVLEEARREERDRDRRSAGSAAPPGEVPTRPPAPPLPAWKRTLEAALSAAAARAAGGTAPGGAPSAVGETRLVVRASLGPGGLALRLRAARIGKRGPGAERSFHTGYSYPTGWPPFLGAAEQRLIRLLVAESAVRLGMTFEAPIPVPPDALDPVAELLAQLPYVFFEESAAAGQAPPVQGPSGRPRGGRPGAAPEPRRPLRVDDRPLPVRLALEPAPEEKGRPERHYLLKLAPVEAGDPRWQRLVRAGGAHLLRGRRAWLLIAPEGREEGEVQAELVPLVSGAPPELILAIGSGIRVPESELGDFLNDYLGRLGGPEELLLPPEVRERLSEEMAPRPVLTLAEREGVLEARLLFAYGDGPAQVGAGQPEPEIVEAQTAAGPRWARRDRAAEGRAVERLAAAGLAPPEPPEQGTFTAEGDAALDFLAERVPELLREGWEVLGEEGLGRLRVVRTRPRLRAEVRSGIDWLDLELSLETGEGRLGTEELLAALDRGTRWVRLPDGRAVRLPERWFQAARQVLEGEREPGTRLAPRLPRWQAPLVERLAAHADEVRFDRRFEELAGRLRALRQGLRDFRGIPRQDPPLGLAAELRPYQRQGLDWLRWLAGERLGGVLADEMGLGKTVQALALLLGEKEAGRARDPSLVVAPTSLVFNWFEEARRFTPALDVLALVGPERSRHFGELARHDVILTSYALLRRDIEVLARQRWHLVVLDEAQAIKNAGSETARAARRLDADARFALTGTPLENRLDELWSVFDFVLPAFLGSEEEFRKRWGRPVAAGSVPAGAEPGEGARAAEEAREALERLGRRIRPFLLRRTKRDVAPELPPRTETVLRCEMGPAQRRLYERILRDVRERVFGEVERRGIERSRITILDGLLKLRQVACHPQLLRLPGNRIEASAKLELFRDLVREIAGGGHRVLVFSQFVRMLGILRRELDHLGLRYEYLDGGTRDRAARVHAFQEDPAIPVFLMSLKAGGYGLNLTGASYVIHFDPWWNPAAEEQATDRVHRIGQSREVFSYKLITRGTVEEKILDLQARKRELARDLLAYAGRGGAGTPGAGEAAGGAGAGEAGDLASTLTREDLEVLFRLD